MKDSSCDCDRWNEPLSLLAAGCLPADEEADVRRHLVGCGTCSAKLAELTALCTLLAHGRPPAAARAAAVRDRWQTRGLVPARPPLAGRTATLFGVSAALAAALVVCVAWLAGRELDERGRRSGEPQPSTSAPRVGNAASPPTLLQFERALAKSDEAFDALLRTPGASMAFEPLDARSLLKEHF